MGNSKKNKGKKNKNLSVSSENDNEEQQHHEEEELGDDDEDASLKRQHNEDDSDVEEETPRKKKKKKQAVQGEADKKGKKSIRQMKREKHAQRQADAQAVVKDQLKNQCLSYLSQWKHDKQNWKFMKAKQVWLYKNKFSTTLLPDASWPLLLQYFESAQGNIRNMLLNDAKKVIKQMDDWTESQNDDKQNDDDEETEDTSDTKKPDDNVYKRARDLIQCLEE